MKREIKFRAWDIEDKKYHEPIHEAYKGKLMDLSVSFAGELIRRTLSICAEHESMFPDKYILEQYTGYIMFNKDVFFDDLVSNNFKTDKEVLRQIVFYKGCIMMKRVKGKSTLPKYLPLHEWFNMNFHVVGNIHQNKDLIK